MAKLGEVCLLKAGKFVSANDISPEYNKGLYPCFGGNGIRGYVADYTHDGEFPLIGRQGALCGNVNLASGKFHATEHAVVVQPKIEMNVHWLYYAINAMNLGQYATGAAQPGLAVSKLETLSIEIPNISEQNKIAQTLYKVEQLVNFRKQQLAKLDELVKARFFEMFGEISDNSMNWDCFTIGKLISTIESGWSGNGKQREKHADEIAVLKVSAVTKGYFIPTECKVLDDQHNIKKYVYPQKGDILFSRANTKEMVGATVLIKKDYPDLILPDKLWKIRFCTDVNPIYMKYVLSTTTVRNAFSAASTGTSGSMYNVSMEKFKGVIIPVPPLSVQNEFAAFVERVDQQKQTVQQSLEKLELMKKALMQEYFG